VSPADNIDGEERAVAGRFFVLRDLRPFVWFVIDFSVGSDVLGVGRRALACFVFFVVRTT